MGQLMWITNLKWKMISFLYFGKERFEVWDATASDPKLLGKRGIEKQPFQLPDFIAATGIEKIRQGGFDMICSGRDKIGTPEQFKQAEETAVKLDLDGVVVIGGDDSNTNACLLAENFRLLTTFHLGSPFRQVRMTSVEIYLLGIVRNGAFEELCDRPLGAADYF